MAKAKIKDLKFDVRNFNRHTPYGMELLEKSIKKFGLGRSILIDKDNNIIAGNGVTEVAEGCGIEKVRIVETDGTEIIAVKRKDIALDSPEGREMAFADNAVGASNLKWDAAILKAAEEEFGFKKEDWGLQMQVLGKAFANESEKEADIAEYPITILNSKEEYDLFMSIRDKIGAVSNSETFFFIMKNYQKTEML